MKKQFLSLLLICSLAGNTQELVPQDQMPDIALPRTLDGTISKTSSYKGKLLVIDFWATWCSPCITAMKELEDYKKALGDKIEVIAISDEPEERLRKFMKARPTTLTLASDTAGDFRKYFPHHTIPHTVLIGPEGKVYAITNASNITLDVLKVALKGVNVNLPYKKDKIGFDINTYFTADSTRPRQFSLLPAVEGTGTMSKNYMDGSYKNRRFTIVNMPIEGLFRLAYNKNYSSVINEYDTVKRKYADEEKYCLDAWIEEPDQKKLMAFIQEELKRNFIDVEVSLEKRKRKVLVLKAKKDAISFLKPSKENNDLYGGGGAHFEGNGVKLDALADYIESFGLYNGKVVNETGIAGRFDLFIQFQPEKKDSFKDELAKSGLYLETAEREVEMLVLKKK
ncbi:redoxin domain-containing protein [Terrimonas sp. NA20]|uniref:Redoxin domain-containing protein n=1 Tax=Terrimonas ginsenosidimutans TaxID=2908004 RepID=A0ABS9KTV1_9BACT|nr:redoxin domain-containing protein [Terrimonas ginsenosidimutans]MCG2615754.1 redoxin domain-containing protein [Terrimonas ginsenosidimutans]